MIARLLILIVCTAAPAFGLKAATTQPTALPATILRQRNWESISLSMSAFGPLIFDQETIRFQSAPATPYQVISIGVDGGILIEITGERGLLLEGTAYRSARLQLIDAGKHLAVSLYKQGQPTAGDGAVSGKYFRGPAVWPQIPKRGLAGWEGGANAVGAAWYYNWWIAPPGGDMKGQFVPMVKSFKEANYDGNLQSILKLKETHGVNCILGFNEPDRQSQGHTTLEEALRVWPKLMRTGMRLGSPAPSADGPGLKYLDKFMAGVERQHLRVDFIAVHWYRDTSAAGAPQDFVGFVEDLHRKYHRPIWITEFAGINWNRNDPKITMAGNAHFMNRLLPELERLDYVERYAWFSAAGEANLFADTKTWKLTKLGETYRRIGGIAAEAAAIIGSPLQLGAPLLGPSSLISLDGNY